jgi:hypothetical protein
VGEKMRKEKEKKGSEIHFFLLVDTFPDLHGILLKSGQQPLPAFEKDYMQIREMCRPIVRKELNFKRD